MEDPLEQLLKQTGWSYEDVLNRLQKYKIPNTTKSEEGVSENNDTGTTTLNGNNKELIQSSGSTTETVINCYKQEDKIINKNNCEDLDDQDHETKNKNQCVQSIHHKCIEETLPERKNSNIENSASISLHSNKDDILHTNHKSDGRKRRFSELYTNGPNQTDSVKICRVYKRRHSYVPQKIPKICDLVTNLNSDINIEYREEINSTTSDFKDRITDNNSFQAEMSTAEDISDNKVLSPNPQIDDILRHNTSNIEQQSNMTEHFIVSNTTSPNNVLPQENSHLFSNIENQAYNDTDTKLNCRTKKNPDKLIKNIKIFNITPNQRAKKLIKNRVIPNTKTAEQTIPNDVEIVLNNPVGENSDLGTIKDKRYKEISNYQMLDLNTTTIITSTNKSHHSLNTKLKGDPETPKIPLETSSSVDADGKCDTSISHDILKPATINQSNNTKEMDLRRNDKDIRKFNSNRLNNITSALLQKLSTVTENGSDAASDVKSAEHSESECATETVIPESREDEHEADGIGWKIVSVMGGYRSPTPELEVRCATHQSSPEPTDLPPKLIVSSAESTSKESDLNIPHENDEIEESLCKIVKKSPESEVDIKNNNTVKFSHKSVIKTTQAIPQSTPSLKNVASTSNNESNCTKKISAEVDAINQNVKVIRHKKLIKPRDIKVKKNSLDNLACKLNIQHNSQAKSAEAEVSTQNVVIHESVIKPTKTKDVTKIKGWKKKKFAIESLQENIKKDSRSLSYTTQACSSQSVSRDLQYSDSSQSAFSSDVLDRYLTKATDLNISYHVPALDAERTLNQTYIDIQFPNYTQNVIQSSDLEIKKDGSKPKTVAEKRKMEECHVPHVKDYIKSMNSKQRQEYTEAILNLRKKLVYENIPFTRRCFITSTNITNTGSFVLYNGKKIKVSSTKSNKILETIKYKKPKKSNIVFEPPRKPSLLNSLACNHIAYNADEWEPVEVKLPKLYLQVVPKIGKHVHPSIEHLIKNTDTVLTDHQVNFSLSTLKTKSTIFAPRKFIFPVAYANNQKTVSMKKRISCDTNSYNLQKTTIKEPDDVITYAVNDVIGKLLDYIDIQEQTNDVIQMDNDEIGEHKFNNVEVKKNGLELSTKLANKRESDILRKAAKEMRRLSCKVVSVLTDDENISNGPCSKEYCLMGCICKSIKGNLSNLLKSHCGLSKCMFKCTCEKKPSSFQDVLSEGAINRLQGEATKNLAKVEKEFAQTIIKTNNRFIVVSDSNERKRRKPKLPKKYDDFVEEDFFEKFPPKITSPKSQIPPTVVSRDDFFRPCYVKLPKYNLNNIIPYCMTHALYKCHCRNESRSPNKIIVREDITAPQVATCAKTSLQSETTQNAIHVPKTTKQISTSKKKLQVESEVSSRTRGIEPTVYLIRNKSELHLNKIRKSTKRLQLKLKKYLKANASDIMREVNEEESNGYDTETVPTMETKHIRKQKLQVLSDVNHNENKEDLNKFENITHTNLPRSQVGLVRHKEINPKKELKLQRRRTKPNGKDLNVLQRKEPTVENSIQKTEKQFLQFLSKHNSQIRILPWSTLASRYENGSFQLWFLNYKSSSTVMLTENGKRPSLDHSNVKLFEHLIDALASPSNVVLYLINKEIPLGKPKDQVLVLLLETVKDVWRICALCDKNKRQQNGNLSISIIEFYGDLDDILKEKNKIPVNNTDEGESLSLSPDRENKSQSKVPLTTNNCSRNSIITRKRFFLPKRLVHDIPKDELITEEIVWASVPNISFSCKWRVISLKNDFACLCFTRCDYSLDYDDILKVLQIAHASKVTILMTANELKLNYPHRKFGIYCDHNCLDSIFIGPYFAHENHDLSFLVFLNNILVDSSCLTEKTTSCYWYRQATPVVEQNDDDVQLVPEATTLIDLTYDSDTEQTLKESLDVLSSSKNTTAVNHQSRTASSCSQDTQESTSPSSSNVLYHSKTVVSEELVKKKLPRFIITNVPNLGYITACLSGNLVDVTCPISKKPRSFPHWPTALTTLQRLLSSRFISIPPSFKLEVTMVEKLDASQQEPLNSKILGGSYVIGEFGVKHIVEFTKEDLRNYEMSETEMAEIEQLLERKLLHIILLQVCKLLSIDISKESHSLHVIAKVTDMVFKEINDLKEKDRMYVREKIALENVKKTLIEKSRKLLAELPMGTVVKENVIDILKSSTSVKNNSRDTFHNIETISLDSDTPYVGNHNNGVFLPLTSANTSTLKSNKLNITRKPPNGNSLLLCTKDASSTTNTMQNKAVVVVQKNHNKIFPNERRSYANARSVSKKSLKLINNAVLKQNSNISKQVGKTSDDVSPNCSKQVFNTVPILSKVVIPGTSTPFNSISGNNTMSATNTVTASPSSGISAVKVGKSTYLTDRSMKNVYIKYKTKTDTPNNSMATLTPLPKNFFVENSHPKHKKKFIRLIQGDQLQYMKVVPRQKVLSKNESSIGIKHATSTGLVKRPP